MKLKVVTSNPGKVREYEKSFSHLGIETEHVKIPYDEIQTSDLEEVVRKGMESIRNQNIKNFIIDDSGLFVDSLKGFPGVWSAYAQKTIGNAGILKLMNSVEERGAEFRCCIGCDIEGETIIVTGICRGSITEEEKGEDGFGFDPIFTADRKKTFAEISADAKNETSHRGNAVRLLIKEFEKRNIV